MASAGIQWPWKAQRMGYLGWWADKVGLRILESFEFRPGVRYLHQNSQLQYIADQTVFGGQISIDDDILNAVNLPSVVENPLRNLEVDLPTGLLTREVVSWTAMAQLEVTIVGLSVRGSYYSGALAPGQFPQPKDVGVLVNPERLIGLAAREFLTSDALNNALSLEVAIHPIQLLTGFRDLEWYSTSGWYIGSDIAFGWVGTTDLTFRQGRELLGDLDLGQEIRDILPNALEGLINTDEAGDLLITAVESRLPLYGFGIPEASGRTLEIESWVGYQWSNKTWAGDVRLGVVYQSQKLSNQHPSSPDLRIRRWAPTIRLKWVFNKDQIESPLFVY